VGSFVSKQNIVVPVRDRDSHEKSAIVVGEGGVAAGKEGVAVGKEGVAAGKDGVAAGKDGVAAGKDGVAAGRDAIAVKHIENLFLLRQGKVQNKYTF